MTKFRVGQRVRIKNPPPNRKGWNDWAMPETIGKVGIVQSIRNSGTIGILVEGQNSTWAYYEDQIERVGPLIKPPEIQETVMKNGVKV